ncbi:MAG: hypothetical protein C0616_08810 [Desulfuromonas sp.]|nr:MAG: hypothetical protein C0616_08810 [Desulfuromonas sp.]
MDELRVDAGFSLVEVMISMMIFAICMLGLAKLQLTALHTNMKARETTEAVSLAQGKLDELRLLPFTHPDLQDYNSAGDTGFATGGLPDSGVDADNLQTGVNASGRLYDLFWNIADDVPVSGAKTIRMIVHWRERGGERQVKIDSVFSERIR